MADPGKDSSTEPDPPAAPRPLVTVIVVAFDRRQFLRQAIESVLNQHTPRSDFEILVVKNFRDRDIDAFLESEGISSLRPEAVNQGEWIAEALPQSRAKVIAFLDDDDLFAPGKITAVATEFGASERLGYFHHGCETFQEQKGPTIAPARESARRSPPPPRARFTSGSKNSEALARAFVHGAAFNLSSIAVRREVLEDFVPILRQIRLGVPAFLFYASWVAGRELLHDPAVYSRYRVHGTNVSATGSPPGAGRWRRLSRLAPVKMRDADLILNLLKENGREGRAGSPVRMIRDRNALLVAATDRSVDRLGMCRLVARLVSEGGPGSLRDSLPYVMLGLLRVVSIRCSTLWPGLRHEPESPTSVARIG